ncbi:GNAT family N-acetyltransferase [Roseibium sp. HPY-6]|uniref:GNAT family N-acetyltransferase n=1 Tax=Roseibium sp. HPY-6 TaxID=3229852 RepID=UPI0033907286
MTTANSLLAHNIIARQATSDDSVALAKLIDIAGEGIPNWLWNRSAESGQTPLDVGAERARRLTGGFSYTNALVTEDRDLVTGMVLSYLIDAAPEDDPEALPAPIAPFVELEKHSVGTWYINALATFPGYRGQGLGSALLASAEHLAREKGAPAMTIQVYAQNTGAVRLYQRLGYKQHKKAHVRLHPCQPYYTGDVLLLIKELNH